MGRINLFACDQIHAFLLEFGISLPKGSTIIKKLPTVLAVNEDALPPKLVAVLIRLQTHYLYLEEQIKDIERDLLAQLKVDERCQRLLEIPGIGPITACVLAGELRNATQFGNARQFAASVGLVPRQYSTGG